MYWLPEGRSSASPAGDGAFVLDDGSEWSFLGTGPDGARLDIVEHVDTFWFAVAAFDPDTRIAFG